MPKALLVQATGELFRLSEPKAASDVKQGSKLYCLNALIWKGSRLSSKRIHDKEVLFTFDPSKHKVVDAGGIALETQELRRAKELICWHCHPEKCTPPPYEEKPVPVYTSVVGNEAYWLQQLVGVAQRSMDYLENPGKFDRTKLASLRFDLSNVLGYFRKRIGDGGMDGGTKEAAAATTP